MRIGFLLLAVLVAIGFAACCQTKVVTSSAAAFTTFSFVSPGKKPDFDSQLKPIFQARCQPCHFQGGKVYDSMPFDKPETITRLGEKLFTRIKDEKEQRLIREFLSQP